MTEDVESHIKEKFDLHKRLGKGAYGIVWKATDRRSQDTVALKKIFDAFRNQTDAQRTFREIMFLQEFGRHPNIIKLFNILRAENDRDIYLVFEFMEADLHNVIKKMTILKDIHKQYIMCQLFRAIRYLHSGNVLHRDLKPSNVLLDADCRVKLADFGLARSLSQLDDFPEGQHMPELTEYVATRWYRSPEILLAAKRYTKGVDMWSLGCILGEMLLGRALFPGSSTINQIERIMNSINKPPDIDSIGSHYAVSVLEKMPQRPKKPIELILLIFAPHKRLNVEQCLIHPYVLQFHNPVEEPALNYDVTLPLPDHIQLTVQDYREKLYEMIMSKKTHIRRIQHDKPVNRVAVPQAQKQQQYAQQEPQSHESSSSSIQRPYSQPNQNPSMSAYSSHSYNSNASITQKPRPNTSMNSIDSHASVYSNGYANGGQKIQPSVSTNVLSKSRRGSTTNQNQVANGAIIGTDVRRSASQSNGLSNGQQPVVKNGQPKIYQNNNHHSYNNISYQQARQQTSDPQQQRMIDAKRKNGTLNGMLSRVGLGSAHYHQAVANQQALVNKNAMMNGNRRNSNNMCPSVIEKRCAPIAQPESSDFESSRSNYPPQVVANNSNQMNNGVQQRNVFTSAGYKPEQKNGVARQNGTRERAQSADNRIQHHQNQQQQVVHENGVATKAKKELRRSHDRLGELLSALRPSKSASNGTKHGFQNIGAILS
ncbi:Mitogen-activated protein kinase [Aphelenchoides bicaudatus]|nr:Mitogen-activated protein kinase [Aphelenchoides bicaudatus]